MPTSRPPIPRAIWILGFVSLLMDVSSEMIHALLPLYLVAGLGAGPIVVGLIEGAAEATALVVRVFSGTLSDALGRRKWLAAAGYGLGAASKPLFAMANGAGLVFAARMIDRVGKGIRGAPRDALIADLAPPGVRGAAFGLRQSLDTVGALAGPLVAVALMLAWADDFRAVFWVAVVPGVLSFLLIAFAVREPDSPRAAAERPRPGWRMAGSLGSAFWGVAALGTALTLARFSEAFLVLRAQDLGVAIAWAPLAMAGMNAVFALASYPVGRLADRMPPERLLAWGIAFLVAADVALALADGMALLAAGLALWGLHMGFTQGLLAALVAHAAPPSLRGTAFGVYNLLCGVAMLGGSALAGVLWQLGGASWTFWAGAAFAAAAAALTRFARR